MAWIVVLAVLLAGVVALNVVVLQLNLRLDQLGRDRVTLKDTNAALEAQLASSGSPFAVERVARTKLRLVQAPPDRTSYVQLAR